MTPPPTTTTTTTTTIPRPTSLPFRKTPPHPTLHTYTPTQIPISPLSPPPPPPPPPKQQHQLPSFNNLISSIKHPPQTTTTSYVLSKRGYEEKEAAENLMTLSEVSSVDIHEGGDIDTTSDDGNKHVNKKRKINLSISNGNMGRSRLSRKEKNIREMGIGGIDWTYGQKCNHCAQVFLSKIMMDEHVKKEHMCFYVCDLCTASFQRVEQLHRHCVIVHGHVVDVKGSFLCHVCGVWFADLEEWEGHMEGLHGGCECFECCYCEEGFVGVDELKVHVREVHNMGGGGGEERKRKGDGKGRKGRGKKGVKK